MVVEILKRQGWIRNYDKEIFGIPEHSTEALDVSLTALVKAHNAPQQELAKELRVSGTTIHKYMTGAVRLFSIEEEDNRKMQFLRKLADYFDIKPTYFREYRIVKLLEILLDKPELIDIFLELAKKSAALIKRYKELDPNRQGIWDKKGESEEADG